MKSDKIKEQRFRVNIRNCAYFNPQLPRTDIWATLGVIIKRRVMLEQLARYALSQSHASDRSLSQYRKYAVTSQLKCLAQICRFCKWLGARKPSAFECLHLLLKLMEHHERAQPNWKHQTANRCLHCFATALCNCKCAEAYADECLTVR